MLKNSQKMVVAFTLLIVATVSANSFAQTFSSSVPNIVGEYSFEGYDFKLMQNGRNITLIGNDEFGQTTVYRGAYGAHTIYQPDGQALTRMGFYGTWELQDQGGRVVKEGAAYTFLTTATGVLEVQSFSWQGKWVLDRVANIHRKRIQPRQPLSNTVQIASVDPFGR